VRLQAHFGPRVSAEQQAIDRRELSSFAARLGRVTRHPIRAVGSGGNFHVLYINRDTQREVGSLVRSLVPGISPETVAEIERLPRFTFCSVYAFSQAGGGSTYVAAIAIIRDEHPPLLRRSCVHEEIAQGLGLPNDSPAARPSIFNDDEEFALLTFDFLSGQFIDVIHWTDDTRDTMVWRFEREGHEIKYGAKLTVREGQAAVFVHEGQLADVFTPGLYMLETNNMPIMTTLQHWDHGFQSPFKSEIYFVNTTRFTDLKWGTKNPIMLRDPEFGPTVRIRAFGTYTVRVTDPAKFLTEIVGTDGEFTMDEISFQIRNIIVQEFSRVDRGLGHPGARHGRQHRRSGQAGGGDRSRSGGGLRAELPEFYIENISLPPAVEEALDKRTSMGLAGDLGKFTQYSAAEAMTRAASNPDGGHGRAWGAGSAWAWAWRWAGRWAPHQQAGGPGAPAASPRPPQPPPPPPPVEHVWHIAENGETKGPYSKAALGRMAAAGELTRDTYVWTAGQDGWMRPRTCRNWRSSSPSCRRRRRHHQAIEPPLFGRGQPLGSLRRGQQRHGLGQVRLGHAPRPGRHDQRGTRDTLRPGMHHALRDVAAARLPDHRNGLRDAELVERPPHRVEHVILRGNIGKPLRGPAAGQIEIQARPAGYAVHRRLDRVDHVAAIELAAMKNDQRAALGDPFVGKHLHRSASLSSSRTEVSHPGHPAVKPGRCLRRRGSTGCQAPRAAGRAASRSRRSPRRRCATATAPSCAKASRRPRRRSSISRSSAVRFWMIPRGEVALVLTGGGSSEWRVEVQRSTGSPGRITVQWVSCVSAPSPKWHGPRLSDMTSRRS
jgi:membrane protease subunit (stomatin/prohibitin family)